MGLTPTGHTHIPASEGGSHARRMGLTPTGHTHIPASEGGSHARRMGLMTESASNTDARTAPTETPRGGAS
jgi:hypothetical protein